jgi:hypothetical protein
MLSLDILRATFKAFVPFVLQLSSTRICITIEGKGWDMEAKQKEI